MKLYGLEVFVMIYNEKKLNFLDSITKRFCALHPCYTEYFKNVSWDVILDRSGMFMCGLEIKNRDEDAYNILTMFGEFLAYIFNRVSTFKYDSCCIPYIVYEDFTRIPVSDKNLRGNWGTTPLFYIRFDKKH